MFVIPRRRHPARLDVIEPQRLHFLRHEGSRQLPVQLTFLL
jgi:hypothetical protein